MGWDHPKIFACAANLHEFLMSDPGKFPSTSARKIRSNFCVQLAAAVLLVLRADQKVPKCCENAICLIALGGLFPSAKASRPTKEEKSATVTGKFDFLNLNSSICQIFANQDKHTNFHCITLDFTEMKSSAGCSYFRSFSLRSVVIIS